MKKLLFIFSAFSVMAFGGDAEDGMAAYSKKNYPKAIEYWTKAANNGSVEAQYNLALMYHVGEGVPQNYEKAIELYKKAADQGDSDAQYKTGLMYLYGNGVKLNKIKAYEYWIKAAKQGNILAQDKLDMLCKESPWACK